MAVYELGGVAPKIDPDAYVHPDAVVIGDVTVGAALERVAGSGAPR